MPTQHSYTITNNSPSGSDAVSEGGALLYDARSLDSGLNAPSTIYVSTASGSLNRDDFTSLDKIAVDFGKKELQKTITVNTKSDAINEVEDFYLLAFKTFDDAENETVSQSWQYNKAFIKNAWLLLHL